MTFRGFPAEAFDFYARLEADNTKAFWTENRPIYDEHVVGAFEALADELEHEYGRLRLFRPYRDVRFSKDKTPYKTAAGALTEAEGGATYYVQVSSAGLLVGSGLYHYASDQLDRWRHALDDDDLGAAIVAITDDLRAKGHEIMAIDALKTAPRGWAKDHPRIELLRLKGLVAGRSFPQARWMHTRKALDRILEAYADAAAMNAWLEANVGPSTLPPPEPR